MNQQCYKKELLITLGLKGSVCEMLMCFRLLDGLTYQTKASVFDDLRNHRICMCRH